MNAVSFLTIYLVLAIIARSYLFSYLADKNNYNLGGAGGFSLNTLFLYTRSVSPQFESLKRICNYIFVHNVVLTLLILMLIFLVK